MSQPCGVFALQVPEMPFSVQWYPCSYSDCHMKPLAPAPLRMSVPIDQAMTITKCGTPVPGRHQSKRMSHQHVFHYDQPDQCQHSEEEKCVERQKDELHTIRITVILLI